MRRLFSSGGSIDRSGGSIEMENHVAGESPSRRDPIRWLIGCGIVLIAAIVVGTTMMVSSFRDRAITNSNRELENAVQLLTRHFVKNWRNSRSSKMSLQPKCRTFARLMSSSNGCLPRKCISL